MPGLNLTPPPEMLPSEWAEEHLYIPVGNARPGRIRFDDMAYQKGMIDTAEHPHIRRMSLMQGAQTGKTTTTIGLMGYYTHHKPRSQIAMQATQTDLNTWLKTKFEPMMAANNDINDCYDRPRSQHGVNNAYMKGFRGGVLMLAWAGSPNTTRGRSAPVIIADEVDGYNYTSEGHPVELLWERSATFAHNRLLIELSTPTLKGRSRIEDSFLEGDMRRYWVVCPDCGHEQTFQWTEQNVRWKAGYPATALYHCDSCDRSFDDYQRVALVRNAERDGGGWRTQGETLNHASFHLNSIYSPFRLLADIVDAYESAVKHRSLQSFTNTIVCETWSEIGEKSDADDLYNRAESYAAQVPRECRILTAGVDVQKDRLEFEVVGWGEGEESWSIDYQVIYGDTTQRKVWTELYSQLTQAYTHENQGEMYVAAAGIDSGYQALRVYEAIRRAPHSLLVFALKGRGRFDVPEIHRTSTARLVRGRWIPDIWTVGVDVVKQQMMRRLNLRETGEGYCHFPHGRDREYYLQLTAEQLLTEIVNGFPKNKWEKIYERNEAWDCRIYAYATLKTMDVNYAKYYGTARAKRKPIRQ